MTRDWLLVETLGTEPAVVAEGATVHKLVPISQFLRRSAHLAAVQTAIADTVASGTSLASLNPKGNRVIRTEPVTMTDGTIHGVHVWVGPASAEPPERPIPGPLLWNLTTRVAADTPESLVNRGFDPETTFTNGRVFAEDLPDRDIKPSDVRTLAPHISAEPGSTYCEVRHITDLEGRPISVGFVVRVNFEASTNGREHLIARAMNWRATPTD